MHKDKKDMINTDLLVFHAISFYNAYIALDQINQNADDHILYMIPIMVNGAFSIEITLKAILAKNQIEYGKEHNILLLFRMLPDSFKQEILVHLFEKAPEYDDDDKWINELILISNAFVDWRYSFEGKPAPSIETRFLAAFANAAIATMFSHYNVTWAPGQASKETAEEVLEKIQNNREECLKLNLQKIQKKAKEQQS